MQKSNAKAQHLKPERATSKRRMLEKSKVEKMIDGSKRPPTEKRKYMKEKQQEISEQRRKSMRTMQEARQEVALQVLDDDELEVMEQKETRRRPFLPHWTHDAFYIGGYIACKKCGNTSTIEGRATQLKEACRGEDSKRTKGTDYRIKRLLQGKLPRPERDKEWPNGDCGPEPKRIRVAHPGLA